MGTLKEKLGNIIIPIVTPFDRDTSKVNLDDAANLADFLIEKKYCDSIAVTGTTGEFSTMNVEERIEMYKAVKEATAGRVPLIAGVGAASVQDAVTLSKEAEKLGYDVVMAMVPFYCKPGDEGIYKSFTKVAESVNIDILLYNIPIFTGVNIEPKIVSRLSGEFENIKGVKDESGINPTQMTEYALAAQGDFTVYNGDDPMILCGLVQGAAGVVSGSSHLIGNKIRAMINFFEQGKNENALIIHQELDPFFRALFPNGRSNPVPVLKAAMNLVGHHVGIPRLPLSEATDEEIENIKKQLIRLGVL